MAEEEEGRARGSHFASPGAPRHEFAPDRLAEEAGAKAADGHGAGAGAEGRAPRPDETLVYLRAADIAARAREMRAGKGAGAAAGTASGAPAAGAERFAAAVPEPGARVTGASAAADTAAGAPAARAASPVPANAQSTARGRVSPEETAVFLAAAASTAPTPTVSSADETGVFLAAALRANADLSAAPSRFRGAASAKDDGWAPRVPAHRWAGTGFESPDETGEVGVAAGTDAAAAVPDAAADDGATATASGTVQPDSAPRPVVPVRPSPRADDDWLFSGTAPVLDGALDRPAGQTGVFEAEPVYTLHPEGSAANPISAAGVSSPAVTGSIAAARIAEAAAAAAQDAAAAPTKPSSAHPASVSATAPAAAPEVSRDDVLDQAEKSSNMVSVLVIISRVTGFFRTAVQAWAIGAAMLASCYTIANQLPNMLYELVVGGMLITAFLPVYVKVRNELGREGASEYASNLLSILLVVMAGIAALSFVFAAPIIWTQSAGAAEGFDSELAIWFFHWFCCEIVLYALSSVFSGVLNAERDYLVSNAAPIYNNVVVILTFVLYGAVTRFGILGENQALLILAIGHPLGVALQVLVQMPALRRHGVRFRLRVNLHDPALRETLSIGLPTLVVTLAGYPTLAVMSSSAMSVTNSGAAIMYYSRVWYVLPYSIFAVPISVTMFTELSQYFVHDDMDGFARGFARGMSKIIFTVVPFTMFLIVFSRCLIAILASGKFTQDSADLTALYLACLAVSLPFHSMSIYLQKACSALLRMKTFAASVIISAFAQIGFCLALTPVMGLPAVALSQAVYYAVSVVIVLVSLRRQLGGLGLGRVASALVRSLLFGGLGSLVGWGVLVALTAFVGPLSGALQGVAYAVAGGLPAVAACFGLAFALGKSDAPFFDSIFGKLSRRRAAA